MKENVLTEFKYSLTISFSTTEYGPKCLSKRNGCCFWFNELSFVTGLVSYWIF